jgi:ribA/ribD-fused uncharacterized protein
VLCGDAVAAAKIMKSKTPKGQMALGKKAANYFETIERLGQDEFDRRTLESMFVANMLKFSQNPELCKFLLEGTKDEYLVESSPKDKKWGTGLAAEHKFARRPSKWKGTNWLGQVLWHVRRELREMKAQGVKDLKQAVLDKFGVKAAAQQQQQQQDSKQPTLQMVSNTKKRKESPTEDEQHSSSSSSSKPSSKKKARIDKPTDVDEDEEMLS